MADFLKDPTNGLWIAILILFVTFYGPRVIKKMPEPMVELLNRNWFRAFIIFVAVYLAQHNIKVSLVIAVIFLLVNHGLQTNQLYESFLGQYGDIKENFSDCISGNKNGKACSECVESNPYESGGALAGKVIREIYMESQTPVKYADALNNAQNIKDSCASANVCNQAHVVSNSSPKSCMAGCEAAIKDFQKLQQQELNNSGNMSDLDEITMAEQIGDFIGKSDTTWNHLRACSPDVSPVGTTESPKEKHHKERAAASVSNKSACGQILHDTKNWVFKKAPSISAPNKSLYCSPGSASSFGSGRCTDNGKVSTKKSVSFNVPGDMPAYVTGQNVGKGGTLSNSPNSYGCQKSFTAPFGNSSDKDPAPPSWRTDSTLPEKQCMHSGQCCGYQGDDLSNHQTQNNICLKLDPHTDHGYCVKMPAGQGTYLQQRNVLRQLVPKNNKLIDNLNEGDLYTYNKNNISKLHLSPHFPIHQPGLDLDKNHPDKSWCGSGDKCSLDWDSSMFDNGSSRGTGPGASYPQHVISDSHNPSAPIGTGCWTYGGDKLPHIIQDLGHTNSIGVVEAVKGQNSKPYHGSPFDDLRDTNNSGGHQRDTFVGYAPPVGNCEVYSKPDLDFTGTATYPLNDTNALKNLRGETASREPMYVGELH